MSEINQKLGFDASGAIDSLRQLQQMLNGANQAMTTFAQSAKKFNDQARPMIGALDRMGTSAAKVTALLDRLGISANKATVGVGKLGQKPVGFAANMRYFDDLSKKIRDAKTAQEQLARTPSLPPPPTNKVNDFGKAWLNVARMFKSMIILTAIRAITNELTGAVEAARKFGLAIAEIQTIGQGLGMTNDELSRKIIELSNALGKPAQDVAEGLYQTISNQVVEAADAFEFLAEAERLAITTHATTAEAVDALSSVMNSYSLEIADASRVSSILFETVNLGRLRLDEIADRIGRITPMAAQMGVRFEELGAAIATMTVQGLKADTAITQVRAILSKLQKPTEELVKVFRSWGVKDGPEALKSFGGLAGVLRKLSKETGGSSSEMAEFFNVVRAMTGVMSLNTDEGQRFADALAKMDAASNKAAVAWRTFIQEDAYSFTKSVNELKNTFLELGQALLPIAQLGADVFNRLFGGVDEGIEVIRAWFSESERLRSGIRRLDERFDRERRAKEKEFTRFNSKEWRDREQVVRESVAAMGVDFNVFLKQMEVDQKASTAVFKGFADEMVSGLEDALGDVADFAKNGQDRIKDNMSSIRDLQGRINDLHYDNVLNKAKGTFREFNLMANQATSMMQQGMAEAWAAGSDPERFKDAMSTMEKAASEAVKGLQAARSANDERQVKRFSDLYEGALKNQISLRQQLNEKIAEQKPLADEAAAKLSAKGAELKELLAAYTSSLEAEQKADTPAQRELEKDIQQRLKASIQKIDFGPDADIMKKLGLDPSSLTRLNFQIKNIFDLKEIQWQGAQKSLQEALNAAKLTATVTLSPEMKAIGLDSLGAQMGLNADDFKSQADFYQQVMDTAKASLQEQNKLQTDLGHGQTEYNKALAVTDDMYAQLSRSIREAVTSQRAQNASAALEWSDGGLDMGGMATNRERLRELNEVTSDAQVQMTEWAQMLSDFDEQIRASQPLTEEQIAKLGDLKSALDAIGEPLPEDLTQQFIDYAKRLTSMSDGLNKVKEAQDALNAGEARFKAADELVNQINLIGPKMLDLKQKAADVNTETGNGVQQWNNQNGAVNGVQQQVQFLNDSVSFLPTTIQSATDAFWSMAEAAEAAALAGAAARSSAGGFAYHGGLMNFLAAGGRGQDQRPAMLAKGEYVVSAGPAAKFFSELNAMNQGSRPVYREQGGTVTNVGDVNVTVKGGDTGQQTVREIGYALRREIKRNNIKLK